MSPRLAGLFIAAVVLARCASQPPPSATGIPTAAPTAPPSAGPVAVGGGCGSSVVFAGPGPDASLGLSDNPWAAASPGGPDVVAYFWLKPPDLLRVEDADGLGTKVLWVVHGGSAGPLAITAHPLGAAAPVVPVWVEQDASPADNYPSNVAVPTPGCWRFEITSGSSSSTLDISVAPTPSAAAAAPSAAPRACRAGDVAAGPVWWTGATASMAGGVGLYGVGHDACWIAGRVGVELRDASGHALPLEVQPLGTAAPSEVVLLPGLGAPTLGGGQVAGRAGLQTSWRNWCGKLPLGPGTVVVTVPGVGPVTAVADDLHPPRCDAPGSPSVLQVGPIIPQPAG
jgi:hypothetical protein